MSFPVSVSMLESMETEEWILEKFPERRVIGNSNIVLKDGRKAESYILPRDVFLILKGVEDQEGGFTHPQLEDYREFGEFGEMGWTIRPAEEIFTKIFGKAKEA